MNNNGVKLSRVSGDFGYLSHLDHGGEEISVEVDG